MADPTDPVVAFTTFPADGDAVALARALVERGLAACVNVVSGVTSVYRWQGAVQTDAEQQLIIKLTAGQVGALEAALRELHPYDVPEFIVLPVIAGSEAYLQWLTEGLT